MDLYGAVVLVAAAVEELAFRGVIQQALKERFGRHLAVLVGAIAFAAYHLAPLQIVSTFAYGLVLGVLVERRGTLWSAMVAHVALNLLGTMLLHARGAS